MQPTSYNEGCYLLINFSTPDLAPFMTFVVSDINATVLEKSKPCLLRDVFKALNKLVALMLTTGISRNRVHVSPFSELRTHTRIMHNLLVLSFDSSVMRENGLFEMFDTTLPK